MVRAAEVSDTNVTALAQEATHTTRHMVMVNMKMFFFPAGRH